MKKTLATEEKKMNGYTKKFAVCKIESIQSETRKQERVCLKFRCLFRKFLNKKALDSNTFFM